MSDIVQTLRQLDQQIEKLLQQNSGLRTEVDRHRATAGRLGDRVAELERQVAAKATPAQDGFGWQPVDAEHPLTAEDHRRMVRLRSGEEWMLAWGGSDSYPARVGRNTCTAHGAHVGADPHPLDIVAVLRPKPAPEPPTPEPAPDDHEWQPVDAEHPLTAEDHRRMVRLRRNKEAVVVWQGVDPAYPFGTGTETYTPAGESYFGETHPVDIVAVLRPKTAPEPPKPLPGEVWESELLSGGAAMVGEIVSTRSGLAYLLDAEGDGLRRVAFAITGDRLTCDNEWLNRKLTRRVS